jgi:thiamine biosynthesis lipoprotein
VENGLPVGRRHLQIEVEDLERIVLDDAVLEIVGEKTSGIVPRKSPASQRCTSIGTAAWSMRNSSARSFLTAAWLVLSVDSPAGDRQLFEAVEPHMGTLVRIKLYAAGAEQANAGFRAAFNRIAQLDGELSDYQADSELNRICRTAVGRPVAASADLFGVLAASQKLAAETGGAFDATLGPVIRLWRQARKDNRLPSADALREAARHSGYRKLHLGLEGRTVTLDEAGMQLDVGGIAKGYAADAALSALGL